MKEQKVERVVRMDDNTFVNMISESVLRTINEGFWSQIGKPLAKYAFDRIVRGRPERKLEDKYDTDKDKMANIRKHYEKNDSLSKEEFTKYDEGAHEEKNDAANDNNSSAQQNT